jgi:hypothetical protein
MVDANRLTLQFYRQTCRLLPQIISRSGQDATLDMYKSKLNVAKWIRKGANMRNPQEVTDVISVAYDFLFACAYCDFESGYYNRFLVEQPIRYDGSKFTRIDQMRGLNLIDYNRFKGKSNFLRKFVKGVRPLLN